MKMKLYGLLCNEDLKFAKLCEETYSVLRKYAANLSDGNLQTADDIVQNTYLCAKEKQSEVVNHINPHGWLFLTAKNMYYKEINRKKTKTVYETDLSEEIYNNIVYNVDYNYINYKDKISRIMSCGIFREIFSALTDKEKKLLIDCHIKNVSLKNIAKNLNENYEKLRKMHYRLILRLRKKMESELLNRTKDSENPDDL